MTNNLPDKIDAGAEHEIHICPLGEYAGVITSPDEESKPCTQMMTAEALQAVCNTFAEGDNIFVDVDHVAESGGSTESYGWVKRLRFDETDGLFAVVEWTDIGADAINAKRYRFNSPVFAVDVAESAATPTQLTGLALTNQPNLPVRCVLNRAVTGTNTPVEGKVNTMTFAEKLGLAPDATEADCLAALDAMQARIAELEASALNTEAEKVADENADKIENRAEFVKSYCANKTATMAVLGCMRKAVPAEPEQTDISPNRATVPTLPHQAEQKAQADADAIVAKYKAMTPGADKDAYLAANKNVLTANMH